MLRNVQFALEKTRKKVCRSWQLEIGINDDMKLLKRRMTLNIVNFPFEMVFQIFRRLKLSKECA